jgi:hypothetical protein
VVAFARKRRFPPGGGPTSAVQTVLILGQIDVCLRITLVNGQGETPEHRFQFASDLSSAAISTTVPAFDSISLQMYDFGVNLTWVAQDAPVSQQDKEIRSSFLLAHSAVIGQAIMISAGSADLRCVRGLADVRPEPPRASSQARSTTHAAVSHAPVSPTR